MRDVTSEAVESAEEVESAQGCIGAKELVKLYEAVTELDSAAYADDAETSHYKAVVAAGKAWLSALGVKDAKFAAAPKVKKLTFSQQQAVSKALDYLDYTAFSKSGLAKQLKFEGFSKKEAEFAVEYIDVDWKEQAALKAEDYLDYSSFSRKGLIAQLEFEGFTRKQAEYGAKKAGL